MAEIADNGGGGGHKGGKKRAKKNSTRVDMTPMVDLAFLLLTFFVLTSTFSKPKIMSLVYPAKQEDQNKKKEKIYNAITFLLTEDRIFYYEGELKDNTVLYETHFGPDGVRKLLADKNHYVLGKKAEYARQLANKQINDSIYKKKVEEAQSSNEGLKVLVKTDLDATCKNFIDLIDELRINDIGVIAPVDLLKKEENLMKQKMR